MSLVVVSATAEAAEFHATTAQELQTALTVAASNGEADTAFLAAGYYPGQLSYASSEAQALTLRAEPGVAPHEITLDGGRGRALNINMSAAADVTVAGITLLRNCGAAATTALQLSTSGDALVSNCTVTATGAMLGAGIGISKADVASIVDCTVTRAATATGDGVTLSGATGGILLERTVIDGQQSTLAGRGLSITAVNGTATTLRDNRIAGHYLNVQGTHASGVWLSIGTGTLLMSGNTVEANQSRSSLYSAYGSGIYITLTTGSATLEGNTVSANYIQSTRSSMYVGDGYGAGVYVTMSGAGNLSLTGNRIDRNTIVGNGDMFGGGLYILANSAQSITLAGNRFAGNQASAPSAGSSYSGGVHGGGLYVQANACPAVVITNNLFSGNQTLRLNGNYGAYGGGLFLTASSSANITLADNTLSNNTSAGSSPANGGGMYATVPAGTLTVERNRIIGNAAGPGAGAEISGKTLRLVGNVVAGNTQSGSTLNGGGLKIVPSTRLDMVNNTVTANSAAGQGGGAWISVAGASEILAVHNNIIWGNTADGLGGDVYVTGTGASKVFTFNCAGDVSGLWDVFSDNTNAAPMFYDAPNHDYHLMPGSPCLDAGKDDAPELPAVDLDGEPRVVNARVDIGADEMPAVTDTHPADLDADWTLSAAEYADYAAAWKTNGLWVTPPSPVDADFATRAGFLRQQNNGAYQNTGGKKPACWTPDTN
ncbi:MAG: right-handed parallel beta-helix repeat-containing protein [Kiritimatiellia bacterium]|nr:right-handed parallel beta-helix repeat-containing protein [Kiritimatiellia bacterium]